MKSLLPVFCALATLAHAEPLTLETVKTATAKLDEMTQEQMVATGVPGIAVAVVFQGEVVFAKGYGVRTVGKKDAVDADTVFQLASLSKPVASTVLAKLVGEGKVSWDAKISDLDPSFLLSDPWVTREVTVRDLFAHRSGLPDHAGDLLEDLGYDRAEVLHRLRFQPPEYSFRSGYAYTNFGLTEAAVAAVKGTGKAWEEVSEEELYRPLGMKSTSSRFADFSARKNRALGHVREDGKWVQKYQRQPDAQSPAGGVSSSVNDMTKWMKLHLAEGKLDGKTLIAEEALRETHFPQVRNGMNHFTNLPTFYGLGWNVSYDERGGLRISHSGAFSEGAATAVYLVPAAQLGVIVLTNGEPIGLAEALGESFLDEVFLGKPRLDWVKVFGGVFAEMAKSPMADYSKVPEKVEAAKEEGVYLGSYGNDFYGAAEIVRKDGGLALVLGPKKKVFPLTHWSGDIFTFETSGENAMGKAGVFFAVGPDGKADSVVVESLNLGGLGTFRRVAGKWDGAELR